MNRSDYLKEFLTGRGVPASRLAQRELTYAEVEGMSGEEYEWNQLENRANLNAAIELNPQERARRKQIFENIKSEKLFSGSASEADIKSFAETLQTLLQQYPWVIDCHENGAALMNRLKAQNVNFTNAALVDRELQDAISEGALRLSPAAVSPEFEQRYGDELHGASCPASGQMI